MANNGKTSLHLHCTFTFSLVQTDPTRDTVASEKLPHALHLSRLNQETLPDKFALDHLQVSRLACNIHSCQKTIEVLSPRLPFISLFLSFFILFISHPLTTNLSPEATARTASSSTLIRSPLGRFLVLASSRQAAPSKYGGRPSRRQCLF